MSLRTRFATVVAVTVTVTLLLAGVALQTIAAAVLIGAVDDDLRTIAASVERDPRGILALTAPGRGRLGGAAGLFQIIDATGTVQRMRGPLAASDGDVALPVDAAALAVARGEEPSALATVDVEGVPLRMLTVPLGDRFALQVARPIDEVEAVVARLRRATLLVVLVAVLGATLVARRVAGRAIRPVADLTASVEQVRSGSDLAGRSLVVPGAADDEVARLARAFDAMLARLDAARLAQERLAADAAHELRTPLTSLRTNIEVLVGASASGEERLGPEERGRLAADLLGQVEELTVMVDGLVALARIDASRTDHRELDVRALVADVVDAARRRHPQRATDLVHTSAGDAPVVGDERELALAVSAMLDNAVKYAPDGPIEVEVTSGDEVTVTVRDCGPGVDADALPHLFERFYRSPEARSAPGAGLGLALVARVAEAHGGRAHARTVEPSGLAVSLVLPTSGTAPQRA